MKKKTKLIISIFAGIILFICTLPMQFSIYIPDLHSYIIILKCAVSSILFSIMLFRLLNRCLLKKGIGIIFFFIILSGIGHAIYTVMFYSAWICLGLSIAEVITIIAYFLKRKK